MALDVSVAYAVIDLVAYAGVGIPFEVLDSVGIQNGAQFYSILDFFLIATYVVDLTWDILDEIRT